MGSAGSSNGSPQSEAPNSLISDSLLKTLDMLCEGPISGFCYMGGQYGYDPLTATYFNDVQFRNTDGSYNYNTSGQGFAFSYTLGTPTQFALTGFANVTTSVPLPPDTSLSNPPINAGLPKNLIVTFNTNQYPDANGLIVNYRVPQLYTTANGAINGFEVDVQASCSLNGGPFIPLDGGTQIIGKNTSPYFKSLNYTLPITTPPQTFYQWTLQFVKTSLDVDSVAVADTIYVDSVSITSASQYNYPNTALVGLYIDANQFGSIPARAYLIQGLLVNVPSGYTPTQYDPGLYITQNCTLAPVGNQNIGFVNQDPSVLNGIFTGISVTGVGIPAGAVIDVIYSPSYGDLNYGFHITETPTVSYTGVVGFNSPLYPTRTPIPAIYPEVWNGTFVSGVWTDNPAWVFNDLLTNTRYGLGQYINTSNIDIWTLYQISQYCDEMVDNGQGLGILEPQFTCNVYISEPDDAYNMLLNMSSVFRGMLYYANGAIRANLSDNKTPVFNYTNANVIGGQFNYSSTARSARHNSVRVKYTDPSNLYRDNYVYVQDNQGILQYGNNPKEITAFACSSMGQATRVANWILTTERLRTETVSFQVGMDGLFIRPGDVFYLYDNFRMNRSQGGRVQSFDPTQTFITLDRPVNLDSGCIYALSCLVPAPNFSSPSGITGSDEIPLIQNSQIQAREVLNADLSGVTTLQVNTGFSGLSLNAVWILTCSGVYSANYVPTVFEQAPQYECLTINQSAPGIFDVLALNYNTGINYSVNTGFTTIMNPVNSGNPIIPPPPTDFTGYLITGALSTNSYYQYLNLTWVPPIDTSNVNSYIVSGETMGHGNGWSIVGTTFSTGLQFIAGITGLVDFKLASVSKGGVQSLFQSTQFYFPGPPGVDPSQIRFYLLPDGFGDLEQIAVFYNRPEPAVTSTRVFYATGATAPFNEVLDQSFYPALGISLSGLSTSGTTAYFQCNSYDAPTTLLSQGAIQQANNTLLFLLENELMSIGGVTGFGNNEYAFSMSRGVLGTYPATHSGNLSGWAFFSADINSFSDQSIVKVFNSTGYDTGVATRYFQIENNTATLQGSIVPAAPGLSYVIPNPQPNPPTSLTGTAPGGPLVHLTWTAPQNTDIEQYQVYRATAPFSVFTGIATTTNTFYDDISVSPGNTYAYYVTTEATNAQQSTQSNILTIVPPLQFPTGITPYPPANTNAPSLYSQGNYFSQDGTLLAYLTFSVPAGNSGDAYTNLLYCPYGQSINGGTIGGQTTGITSQYVTLFDLSPNLPYSVGSQAVSNFGIFSPTVTLGTASPYTTPATAGSPGSPGGPPNAPTNVQISGGLGNTANFVAVTWNPNSEANLEEYGVYRSVSNSQPSNPIAYVATTQYVDATVTGGSTYYYWVTAINRSEQQSSSTASSPSNITVQGAPAAAGVAVCTTTGFYYASDGTVLNSLTFNVPELPAYAFGQQLLYGHTNNTSQMLVGGDVENAGSTTTVVLNDLTPSIGSSTAVGYYVALKPYSQHGVPGPITFANGGNPYPTPGNNIGVTAPTNVQVGPALYGSLPTVPPKYTTSYQPPSQPATTLLAAITGSWTASPDPDIVFYEYYVNLVEFPPNFSDPVNYQNTVPASQLYCIYYQIDNSTATFELWVRAINRSGATSSWTQTTFGTLFFSLSYAGDLGSQSRTTAQLTTAQIGGSATNGGVKIGDITAASVKQVNTMLPYYGTLYITGGTTYEQQSLNISSLGFTSPPNAGIVISNNNLACITYNPYWGGQTTTYAVLDVNAAPGYTLPSATTLIINYLFTESQ